MSKLYRFLTGTLRGRLILSVALVHAVLMAFLIADLTTRQRSLLLERQHEEAATVSRTLAASAAGWIASLDVSGLQELAEAQGAHPGVVFVILVDHHGRVLASTDKSRIGKYLVDLPREAKQTTYSRTHTLADVAAPAFIGERHVGWARVGVGEAAVGDKLAEITRSGFVYALAAILIGSVAAWFMGRRITNRLHAVQETIDAVRSGDHTARTHLSGRDEAAAIAREFNAMLDSLDVRDAELHASEERYRALIEKVQTGILVYDQHGLLLTCNPVASRLLGLAPGELIGKTIAETGCQLVREDGGALGAEDYPINRVLSTGKSLHGFIVGVQRGDGDTAWLLINAEPEYHAAGEVSRIIVSLADITERKQVEQERLDNLVFFASMDRVSRAIQGASDVAQMMRGVLDVSLSIFGCERALLIYPCDPDAPSWKVVMERQRPDCAGLGVDVDLPMDSEIAATMRLLRTSDYPLKMGPGTERPLGDGVATRFGIHSCMGVALYPKIGMPWQFAIHQCTHGRVWTEAEERLMQEIGRRLTDGLTSLLSHQALETSETRYRRMVDTSAEGIWAFGADLKTTFVNARMADMLGYEVQEIIGHSLRDFMFEEDLPDHLVKMESRRSGVSENYERRFRRKGGQELWTQVSATPIMDRADGFMGSFAMFTDITERKYAEAALLRLNRELQAISNCNQTLVRASDEATLLSDVCRIICEKAGYVMAWVGYASPRGRLSLAASAGAETGFLTDARLTWSDTERGQSAEGLAIRTGAIACIDDFATDQNVAPWREEAEKRGYCSCIALPLKDEAGTTFGVLGIYSTERNAFNAAERRMLNELAGDLAFGITTLRLREERNAAEEQMRIAATAFEAQEGIVITDAEQQILRVNRAFVDITGYSPEEIVGATPRLLSSGRHDRQFYDGMWERIGSDGFWQGEIWNRRKNGDIYPEWLNITAVKNPQGSVTHYVGTLNDITERKASEQKIEHLAFYDLLTDLPNRRLLMDRLQQALAVSSRTNRMGAVLFIDLDNFKVINDTYGHDAGDQLLISVARRLMSCVREGDTIARLGGDEFVVMLEDLSSHPPEAAAQAKTVAEKIMATLNQVYVIGGRIHHSTPSIGAALFVDGGSFADELLKQADIAMYQAKSAGRNTLRFFDPDMQAVIAARAELEAAMRSAIDDGQFMLYYQLQFDEVRGITGAEALLRWKHPERGIISPAELVPLAEETGLILPIGQWVLERACAQLHAWSTDPERSHLELSINVSARQFRQDNFFECVRDTLMRANAPAHRLKLELTESLVLDDVENTIQRLHELKQLGISFSMDDFGTGYSSLSYLTRLPLDQLKIDRSFVENLPESHNDAVVAQSIITLAKSLGIAVIAEGVETEAQYKFLAEHGCPAFQGFLFSRPVPLVEFEKRLDATQQMRAQGGNAKG